MRKTTRVYLLYADLIGSRKIEDKTHLQKEVDNFLATVNQDTAKSGTHGGLHTWKGIDEIAGIVKTPAAGIQLLHALNSKVSPHQFRAVIVEGEIDDLPEKGKTVADLNGQVFIDASEAMKKVKAEGNSFLFTAQNSMHAGMLSNYELLVQMVKGGWTKAQTEIYNLYQSDLAQVEIAGKLKISPQAVSKTLAVIEAERVKKLEAEFKIWMQQTNKPLPE